ncbi:CLAVATA3/ESR (CLE)-related protein 45 [Quillaja saponaria]|uniref:CLAVATA3/ESR (CLE)-related protein 45 n=1 Tax=Quillaja saponaria TaxID=32244 RepID=A0AAD7PIR0_QUISA|nr:CLAVATA3/ESR (CLE)-related protein 45 [Quillaja saponaria]
MNCLVTRGLFVLVCIGFLACQPNKVSGLRSIDLALRWNNRQLPFVRSFRILKAASMEDLQSKLNLAPAPSMTFDPNQSNKRTVRKGSDPIHNRC